MKLFTLAVFVLMVMISGTSGAQTYPLFNTTENIDIANIKAAHLVHGDMWQDLSSKLSGVEFPKGSGKYIGGTSALWMSAYDGQNVLQIAAQMYRTSGTDYWPGPVDSLATTQAAAYATSQKWAKIWKINSSQIDSFLLSTTHSATNTPAAILEWPAKGNPYAIGAGSASLTITKDMAPFVDVDADGIYNPLSGDYPKMKGSQMLWWVINDAGGPHTVSSTGPLRMEIRMSAYAYKLGTVADNIIFYEYEMTNKSTAGYNAYRMGVMADFDIGEASNDFVGFDSGRRMGVIYKGSSPAGGGTGLPPAAGLAIMELPGDTYHSYTPAGSFVGFRGDNTVVGDPRSGLEFNYMLHSSFRNGQTFTNGSPYSTSNEYEACDGSSLPADRRFTIASNSLNFLPGTTRKFAAALVVADSTGICPNMDFTRLHNIADTAYKIYWNPFRITPPAAPTGIAAIRRPVLRIYPNPATSVLHVETADGAQGMLSIYDALGKSITLPVLRHGDKIDISTATLANGVYTIRYQGNDAIQTNIFVKE